MATVIPKTRNQARRLLEIIRQRDRGGQRVQIYGRDDSSLGYGAASASIIHGGSAIMYPIPISRGGTGQITAALARLALLPSVSGNALKVLRVNAGETDYELASGGAGDVVGPGSATDNALARFDSTTGKLIQNSLFILSDAGVLSFDDGSTFAFGLGAGKLDLASTAVGILNIKTYGDTHDRFVLENDGDMQWGTGSAAQDTVLARKAANLLGLNAGDAFLIGSTAGNHASTTNGIISYNSSTNKFEFRENGAWVNLDHGDVVGPGSATDNAVARFDGTTGKLIQNSVLILSDTGIANLPEGTLPVGSPAAGTGDIMWNSGNSHPYARNKNGTLWDLTDNGDYKVMKPFMFAKDGASRTSISTSDQGTVVYYGRAYKNVAAAGTISILAIVTQAWVSAGTTPWCEVAILTGNRPAIGGNPSLTVIGTSAIASAAGTGIKTYTITLSAAIEAGDELWIGSGSKATTTRQIWRANIADEFGSGLVAAKTTMGAFSALGGSPVSFTMNSADASPVFILYLE